MFLNMFFRNKKKEKENEAAFELKCETLYQFAKKRFMLEQQVVNAVDFHPSIKARQFVIDLINNGLVDAKYRQLWQKGAV